jgi:PTS system mannose-specific IIA component
MIGIVLVSHGRLADELVAALEHVVGPQEHVVTVCIGPNDDMEQRRKEILAGIETVEQGDGVVLLTDMFGGTPSNLAISVMNSPDIEVIAGVNLPMLVKLASVRGAKTLADSVADAQEAGRKYISVASKLLKEKSG